MILDRLNKKAQTGGISVFLSVLVAVFILGLLVAIFVILSGSFQNSVYTSVTSNTTINESSIIVVNESGFNVVVASYRDVVLSNFVATNASNGVLIAAANYTVAGGNVRFAPAADNYHNNTIWNVSYVYSWEQDNEATNALNQTSIDLANATDWFSILITFGAIVAVILMVALVIVAMRGWGGNYA